MKNLDTPIPLPWYGEKKLTREERKILKEHISPKPRIEEDEWHEEDET